jgi:hypothetical protein
MSCSLFSAFILFICLSIHLYSTPLEVQNRETTFTFFSFVTLNKYNDSDTTKLNCAQKYVRSALIKKLDLTYRENLKAEFDKYNNHMFEYWLTLFALNCSEPPHITSRLDLLESYNKEHSIKQSLQDMRSLEPLLPLMNDFYKTAGINSLFHECSIWYDSAYTVYYNGTMKEISKVLTYLKMDENSFFNGMDKIVIIPNLIGPRGSAMGPQFMGVKYDVQSPHEEYFSEISVTPHEYIHDMVKHLTKSDLYKEKITAIVNKVWEKASGTDAAKYYNDKILYFDECLVRTIDYVTSIEDEERLMKSLEKYQAAKGFYLVIPMAELLKNYKTSTLNFDDYFIHILENL